MIRLYLDQCHWSDIARDWAEPKDVQRLHALADTGRVQHVFSIAHIIETLQCKQEKVKRLLIDCMNSAGIPLWIKCKDILIREEVTGYFLDFMGRDQGAHIDPFSADFFKSIAVRRPAALACRRKHLSVKAIFRFIEKASPAIKRRLLAVGETELTPTRALFHARTGPPSLETLNAFVDLYIPKELPGGTPVTPRVKHAFLVQFDLARCPALMNLIWIVHHMSRAGLIPEAGDILDLYHAIPAYSYCDVFVTDKRIADFIRRLKNPPGRFAATFKSLPQALRYIEGIV
jgi:hypothetical protein